jgi:uncharacterized membrane protein
MTTSWVRPLERVVRWCLRHWLLLLNLFFVGYAALPWLAPLAHAAGLPLLGRLIFAVYGALCHQDAARSFFWLGHQVAYCHRDVALYTTIALGGLCFGLVRRHATPLSLRAAVVLSLPIVLDGGSHLLDDLVGGMLRGGADDIGSLNFWLRMVTGVLAGLVVVATLYPRVERDLAPLRR